MNVVFEVWSLIGIWIVLVLLGVGIGIIIGLQIAKKIDPDLERKLRAMRKKNLQKAADQIDDTPPPPPTSS